MENLESYLATIDELVDDENKIVTYKSVSQQLALPVDQAKEVLQLYIKNNGNGKISAMYTITGRTKNRLSITIVPEDDLDHVKAQVDSVLSCLPYSVQKAKLLDPSPLYAVDYEMTKKILHQCASFSRIQFHGAKTLSEAEIQQRRFSKSEKPSDSSRTEKINTTSEPAKKSSQKKGIASLFATNKSSKATSEAMGKQLAENKDSHVEKKDTPTEALKPPNPKATKKKGGMDTFMTKGKTDLFKQSKPQTPPCTSPVNGNNSPPSDNMTEPPIVSTLKDDELRELSDDMDIDGVPSEKEESVKTEKAKKARKKSSNTKSRPKKIKSTPSSNEQPAKRRKRIMELSSSSESEPEEDFDEIDIIPPSPVVPPPARCGDKNSRKKRVIKSRTFFDADGSMLTEKVWEEVSCSSEDDVVKKENKTPPETEKKPIFKKKPAVKGKQSSLMGFFNKKT